MQDNDSGSDSDAKGKTKANKVKRAGKVVDEGGGGGMASAFGRRRPRGAVVLSDDDDGDGGSGNGACDHSASGGGVATNWGGGGAPAASDEPWYEACQDECEEEEAELSGKMMVFLGLLDACARAGERMLLFSQSLFLLDVLETILACRPRASSDGMRWKRGRDWLRLDGTTKQSQRMRMVDHFQDESTDACLFLISTKAGNLGINLTAATRVVLFDSSWNPSNDAQAIFRSWRFGQSRPVFVYRLLGGGTVEEKIYARQITKHGVTSGVCDDEQLARSFTQADLSDLYTFPPPPLPPTRRELDHPETRFEALEQGTDDRTLLRLLRTDAFGPWVVGITAHDSLLQADLALELTPEERALAKAAYEQELRPPPPPMPMPHVPQQMQQPDVGAHPAGQSSHPAWQALAVGTCIELHSLGLEHEGRKGYIRGVVNSSIGPVYAVDIEDGGAETRVAVQFANVRPFGNHAPP